MAADDWRLEQLKRNPRLRGVRFLRKAYRQYSAEWDHDHCAACWATFVGSGSEADAADLHEGYATCSDYALGEEYEWVCPECFNDFKEAMGWIEIQESKDPQA